MYKGHPTTAEMKHYTAEEFCADMDAILETITREDTAYIIDAEKGSYVICPAHWFDLLNRRESNYLATYTVQYALLQNRETAELVCADVRRRMYRFSYGTLEKMIDDVTAFLKENPDNEAAAAWSSLVLDLQTEMESIDTVPFELTIDEYMLRDTMKYLRARGITMQQLVESLLETLIETHGDELTGKPDLGEPETKEES